MKSPKPKPHRRGKTKMSEKRRIVGHAPRPLAGPHMPMPAGFAPLLLKLEGESLCIELACPDALLGRHSAADFRLAFPEISRRHCRVVFESGIWHIYDLNSLNGIYVNGERVRDAILYTGDRLHLGCVKMRVVSGTVVRSDNTTEATLRQIAAKVV
jgi:hypothetical protein